MGSDREGFLLLNFDVELAASKRAVSGLGPIRLELEIVTGFDALNLECHVSRYPHGLVGLEIGFGKGDVF